jgi:hypothetical protein
VSILRFAVEKTNTPAEAALSFPVVVTIRFFPSLLRA